jgi:hypothetical protein
MTNRSSLEDRLDEEFAPAWRPEAGGSLTGKIVALGERDGGFGRYPIVTVETEGGEELAVHAVHAVLADELAKHQPKLGERIGIRYRGKIDGGERPYHAYKVVVDRPTVGIDWSTYSEDVAADEPTTVSPAKELAEALDDEADDSAPF